MKTKLLISAVILLSLKLLGQTPEWKYFSNGDKVNVVLETNDHFLFGTESGLIELYKISQQVKRTDRSNSLLYGNSVIGLAYQNDGSLLIASRTHADFSGVTRHTDQGIQRIVNDAGPMITGKDGKVYMITSFGFYQFTADQYTKDSMMGYEIPGQIKVNPVNGDIWFTTFTFGQYYVYKYNGLDLICYDYNDGLPFENPVNQPIAISNSGEVFVSTYSGIYKEVNGTWINIKPLTNNEIISGIAFDNDNVLHAVYQKENEEVVSIIKLIDNNWEVAFDGPIVSYFGYTIKDIAFSNIDNNLILTSFGYGTWIHTANAWSQLKSQSEIADVRLTQLAYIDDNMWILTGPVDAYDSISVLRHNGKEFLDGSEGLPKSVNDPYFKIVGKDGSGKVWARTQYQLFSLSNNKWVPDTIIGISDFNPAYFDAIAGYSDGSSVLYHNSQAYINKSGSWIKMQGAPASTYQTNLLIDSQDRLFISFYDGWGFYDGSWHIYNGFAFTSFKFEEAPNHDVYIFTGYQVLKLSPNSSSPKIFSIPSGEWFSMTVDNKGWIWLASSSTITYFNGFNWISFDNSEAGYIGGSILNIEADKNDNIWIATYNSGLELFNPSGIVTKLNPIQIETNGFMVYPNPCSGSFNLEVSNNAPGIFELYNISGIKIQSWKLEDKFQELIFPLSIPNGIYWIRDLKTRQAKPIVLNR